MPRILCIDGGGIRGIIPAMVLAELEQRTGRAITDCFDLIAGTSTGGIIALALTRPNPRGDPEYSAQDIVSFYADVGPAIFERDALHRVFTLDSLAGPRFELAPLRRALDEYFGDTMLSEALRDVLITSYDIERREPFFFKSHFARTDPDRDFPMRDVGCATSAGPTYFAPARVPTRDRVGYRALVDGGVFANNPTMCAYVEALSLRSRPSGEYDDPGRRTGLDERDAPRRGIEATFDRSRTGPVRVAADVPADDDWFVLSLGTGHNDRRLPYADARGWGLAKWAGNIIDIVFDGVSDTVDYQMRQLLPETDNRPIRYCRMQTELKGASADLGDASAANIERLKRVAHALVRDDSIRLAQVVERLAHGVPAAPHAVS